MELLLQAAFEVRSVHHLFRTDVPYVKSHLCQTHIYLVEFVISYTVHCFQFTVDSCRNNELPALEFQELKDKGNTVTGAMISKDQPIHWAREMTSRTLKSEHRY